MAGCLLVALLCVLTTALFTLADASASRSGAAASVSSRVGAAFAAERGRDDRPAMFADRATAESDNPFEHGRLPLADAAEPARRLASRQPAVTADTGPVGVLSPLPERPPRA